MARRPLTLILAVSAWLVCDVAAAEPRQVQGPALGRVSQQRTRRIRSLRLQRNKLWKGATDKADRQRRVQQAVSEVARLDPSSAKFRKAVSELSLQSRLALFQKLVESRSGRAEAQAALTAAEATVETRRAALKQLRDVAQRDGADQAARDAQREAEQSLREAAGPLLQAQQEVDKHTVPRFTRRLRGMMTRSQKVKLLPFLDAAGFHAALRDGEGKRLKDENGKGLKLLSLIEAGKLSIDGQTLEARVERDERGKVTEARLVLDGKERAAAPSLGRALRKLKISPEAQVELEVVDRSSGQAETKVVKRHAGIAQARVSAPKKTFFNVTPGTFDLFKQVMGPNVVWFLVNSSPGHLHTVVTDQNGGPQGHHITYGVNVDDATVTGNLAQYAFPVLLTDQQMDRFVRNLNAGVKANQRDGGGKASVYGIYVNGKKLPEAEVRCTNWATANQIGSLPRWVRRLEKQVEVAGKGLYTALTTAESAQARAELVKQVLAREGLSRWQHRAVRDLARKVRRELDDRLASWVHQADGIVAKLAREGSINVPEPVRQLGYYAAMKAAEQEGARQALFEAVTNAANMEQFNERTRKALSEIKQHLDGRTISPAAVVKADVPNRPRDLILRDALAKTFGVGRSKDPAKWSYDLLMSKQVPIVGVLTEQGPRRSIDWTKTEWQITGDFKKDMGFNMEIMGLVNADGDVVKNAGFTGYGTLPPGAGELGVVPGFRKPPVARASEPAAAPVAGNE